MAVWFPRPRRARPARIAVLLHSNLRSGGNLAMLRHAAHLAALGHSVEIVFQEAWYGSDISFVPGHQSLRSLLLAERPRTEVVDIAVTNWWQSAYAFPDLPARHYGFFRHGAEKLLFGTHALDAVIDMLMQERMQWYCVSPPLLDAPKRAGHAPVLVPNGVDVAAFARAQPSLPPRRAALRVLVEGPVSAPHKRVEQTIALLRPIEGLEIVHMAGDGSRPSLPIEHALGALPHAAVAGVYAACDVLVKLSAQEAFPMPVLEQFAAGGTAVVARFPGAEQFIADGENAVVVEQGAPDATIRAVLQRFITDGERLGRMRRAAQATAARFDWPKVSGAFASALLAASPRRDGPAQALPVIEAYRPCASDVVTWWAERQR